MYADRYASPAGIQPVSLAIAIALNAAAVAALMFLSPAFTRILPDKPLELINIKSDPPPDPILPEATPQPKQKAQAAPERIDTTIKVTDNADGYVTPTYPPLPPLPQPGTGTIVANDPPVPAPVLTGAIVDPRYARDFQPDYPPGERRAENSGLVVLRVLIGPDGRVLQVERVSAASEAFWRVTERQALAKWRFRPATRDGVAVEAWRTMTVRFELQD
ncbi:TonB family protein [Sphingomonas sp. SUN019]|uniref:energy transducer TonB n=1 Tax=Sphingomonas sp. SUN019 TaxID=2937788 RepID=UPI0021640A76|nr:energy transducer TonB [Sphingomonas sp. SUN019]UVO51083.1 TonB family protein [Sphingomonas sp. SUN019]